ncbi:MAG: peptide deformylase [Brevinematia bacterium]
MAVLEVVTYGNPVLRKKAEEVSRIDKEVLSIIEDMKETLAAQKGVGLAAPQVGIPKRIFIVDLPQEKGSRKIVLLNPKIIFYSKDKIEEEEGCLSFPEVWGNVTRSSKIRVKGTLLSGKNTVIEAEEMFARVLQHEIDHLDGKFFIDYFSPSDKEKNKEKLENLLNQNREKLGKIEI